MYADDTVIYTHGKTAELAANKLFTAMERSGLWLDQLGFFFPKLLKSPRNLISSLRKKRLKLSINVNIFVSSKRPCNLQLIHL